MAYQFKTTPSATVKGKSTTSTDNYTIKGINSSISSATEAATEINKVLDIFGKQIAGDDYMTLTIVKEAEEDA